MIIAYKNIKYDTDLAFEVQEQATIDFINESIKATIDHYNIDDSNRPFEASWKLDEQTEIVKTSIWNTPAPSCGVEKEVLSMRGVEIWHEPNFTIQVKLTLLQNIALLRSVPMFSVYTVESGDPLHIEGDMMYIYDNTLSLENRTLIQSFGGIITDKKIE
jgi:hypothetical protein